MWYLATDIPLETRGGGDIPGDGVLHMSMTTERERSAVWGDYFMGAGISKRSKFACLVHYSCRLRYPSDVPCVSTARFRDWRCFSRTHISPSAPPRSFFQGLNPATSFTSSCILLCGSHWRRNDRKIRMSSETAESSVVAVKMLWFPRFRYELLVSNGLPPSIISVIRSFI